MKLPTTVRANLSPALLVEEALKRGEGRLNASGGLVVDTGKFTGRSPGDKFIVKNSASEGAVDWGPVNQAMSEESWRLLLEDFQNHIKDQNLYSQELHAGADERHRLKVRVVTEYAWHSLFARNLFIEPTSGFTNHDWLVIDAPSFRANPERHGTNSSTVVALNFESRTVLIGDTEYAGEIKKSIFSVLNMVLPAAGVFPMHCSANETKAGETALFFGLSGTGKTTLSADGKRRLIGDDEHGWSDEGIFNFEGGCYAKVVNLTREAEPQIYAATQRFGALLENVKLSEKSREPDFTDTSKTENTRSAYPLRFVPGASETGVGAHPKHVVFLSADAFGVLPPIAKLTTEQAMYHFLSGYTAKVAGTERGVTEPTATFSACFGAPFMSRPPVEYALMLREKLTRHGANVWLLNTGWTGGGYGVGERIELQYTRALVRAALLGVLNDVETSIDPVFGLEVPVRAPGVPSELLRPRGSWADPDAYDRAAMRLADMFRENFARFESGVPREVLAAGPN